MNKKVSISAILAVLAILAIVPLAHGQGTLMQLPPLTDSLGHPIAGATISVFTTTGNLSTGLVCATPVTVFKDVGLTIPFTTLTTDGNGNYPFFIQPQANPYGFTISGVGTNTTQCYGFSAPVPPASSPSFIGLTITGFAKFAETTAPACALGFDFLWGDSTAHRLKVCDNNGSAVQLVQSGVDINTSDQVTATHIAGGTNNTVAKFNATGNVVNSGITDDGTTITMTEAAKGFSYNSVLWVDGVHYTTLAGCYADIPSTGGICMVPPNYSETLAGSLTLSKNNAGFQFMGPALITMGSNQVVINQSVVGPFIFGQVPTGAVVVTSTDVTGTAGVTFVYTGSGTAFSVGGAAANPVVGLRLENFTIDISGAGTSAIGLNLKNVHGGGFVRALMIHGTGPTGAAQSQVGIQTDDGGGFTGDITFDTIQVVHVQTGILFNGQSQEMTLIGCQFWGGAASSTAIDIEALWGIQAWGGNIDNYTTSVKMGGSAGNNFIAMPMGNFTTTVNFGASTLRNTVQVARNTAPVISDSGTLNSVTWIGQRQNGMINAQGPSGALTGNSADQTIFTYSIPAGAIAAGRGIRVSWTVNHTTGAANIAYKLVLGSTTFFTSTSTTAATTTYQGQIQIMNAAGVQNSQFLWGEIFDGATLLNNIASVTSAENTANALTIKLTFNVANTNQVTPTAWMVELI